MKLFIITGANGYIGSHIAVEALNQGHYVIGLDKIKSPTIVKRILDSSSNTEAENIFKFEEINLTDAASLEHCLIYNAPKIFGENKFSSVSVIHCAAYKAVGESVENPLRYYANNLMSTINLLDAIGRRVGIFNLLPVSEFVFSSSASVFGDNPARADEDKVFAPNDPDIGHFITNPYGRSKFFCEEIIKDFAASNSKAIRLIRILRYFNPVGYHKSGLLDEREDSTNIYARIKKCERLGETLKIFGGDYPTLDGTAVRDYVDISIVAAAHITSPLADPLNPEGCVSIENIGTGEGMTVLELVKAVAPTIKYVIVERRSGDAGKCICSKTSVVRK